MAGKQVYLAIDLGAESGRAMAGIFDGRGLALQEIHRFPNGPVRLPDGLHWNALQQFAEIQTGLTRAASEFGKSLISAGVDTWGVDFGLLDAQGALLGNPRHYRDARTDGEPERVFKKIPRESLCRATGLQIMQLNTLFQLSSMARSKSPQLSSARTLLFMPDLFHYWLTGRKTNEWTIASTSQCFNPRTRAPVRSILKQLDIPDRLFPEQVDAGTRLGPLLPEWARATGAGRLTLVAPGTHDTASAVAAVPLRNAGDVFLSSGTWSILGMEWPRPRITRETIRLNFTNEGGVCGRTRLMKNIMGLWIVQECRRTWAAAGESLSYEDLSRLAAEAPAFRSFILPDHASFFPPGDMPSRIRRFCRDTGQPVPRTRGEIVRTALESLALTYGRVLRQLIRATGASPATLHIIGGGSRNTLLNRFAAGATGLPVVAGPVEATAAGNILMQLLAAGRIASLEEGRALIRKSFPTETIEAADIDEWKAAAERYEALNAP
ncbi:MAG: rhamnulokinase family protein [Kiritimatiellia bacterium]|nr:rhamnulokinase family protein [Kiritimatiellia bacterium]